MHIPVKDAIGTLPVTGSNRNSSRYVIGISITAALAGFIFGFDTVVISEIGRAHV